MIPQIPSVVRRLKRVGPLQLGKVLGVLYGLMGLIFVPFFLLMSMAGALIPHRAGAPPPALPIAFGLGFAIAMPIFYAVFGFIFGVVGAWIYNLVARWIGGIEVEVE